MAVVSVPKDLDRVKKIPIVVLDGPRTVCVICVMLCYCHE